MSRALLRQLVRRLLPTDPDFEAFCLDHYPAVSERLARSMDRLSCNRRQRLGRSRKKMRSSGLQTESRVGAAGRRLIR